MATGCFASGPPTRLRTAASKRRFLEHFRKWGVIQTACDYAGIHRNTIYKWQEHDPKFAATYAQAYEESTELFEAEACRRAVEGVEKPVYQGGELVGHIREYSDRMLELVLKRRKPEAYRDNVKHEVSGPAGAPIEVKTITVELPVAERN